MNSFLGFPLNHSDALHNIEIMLDAGLLLISSANEELNEIGFSLIELTKKYSSEASLALDKKISGSEYTEPRVTSGPTKENKVESSGLPNTYSLPSTFAERLRLALSYFGMTQDDLAWKIGLSQGAINSYVTGKVKEAGIARADEIAEAIGINAGWLRYGEGEMTDFCTSKTEEL